MNEYLGRYVVVDVEPPFVYLGRLVSVSDRTLHLGEADVHDLRDSTTTREQYVRDAMIHGIQHNRRKVAVRLDKVVSISLLEDVIG